MAFRGENSDSSDEDEVLNDVMMGDPEVGESDPESGSDSDEGDIKLAEPSKKSIFNRDGLLEKLQDISWPNGVDWIHGLSVDNDQEKEVNVNDDLAREVAFYTQALEGTRTAFEKLQSMGLPFLRPPDYYAEMVKTDSHMEKVKGRLLSEKKRIEEAEERRKARESKALAKKVHAEKIKDKAKHKKNEIESVKKWRKQRERSGYGEEGKEAAMDLSFGDGKSFERSAKRRPGVSPGDRSGGKAGHHGGAGKGKGNKSSREFKNSKFGHGGRKGLKKQNTAETTNDVRSFNKANAGGNKKRKR